MIFTIKPDGQFNLSHTAHQLFDVILQTDEWRTLERSSDSFICPTASLKNPVVCNIRACMGFRILVTNYPYSSNLKTLAVYLCSYFPLVLCKMKVCCTNYKPVYFWRIVGRSKVDMFYRLLVMHLRQGEELKESLYKRISDFSSNFIEEICINRAGMSQYKVSIKS